MQCQSQHSLSRHVSRSIFLVLLHFRLTCSFSPSAFSVEKLKTHFALQFECHSSASFRPSFLSSSQLTRLRHSNRCAKLTRELARLHCSIQMPSFNGHLEKHLISNTIENSLSEFVRARQSVEVNVFYSCRLFFLHVTRVEKSRNE